MMTKTGKKTGKPKARAKPVKAMAMPKIEQPALAAPYTQEQMLEVCGLALRAVHGPVRRQSHISLISTYVKH